MPADDRPALIDVANARAAARAGAPLPPSPEQLDEVYAVRGTADEEEVLTYVGGRAVWLPLESAAKLESPPLSDWGGNPWDGTSDTDGNVPDRTYRSQLPIFAAARGVRLIYQNSGAAAYTVAVAVEDPATGAIVAGVPSAPTSIAPGATAIFEFPGVNVAPDDTLWVRSRVTVGAGVVYRMSGGSINGDGWVNGDALMGGAIAGVANLQAQIKPSAVVAIAAGYTPRAVLVTGDSISAQRWPTTAFRGRVPYINVGQSGERIENMLAAGPHRAAILALAPYALNATDGYGINSYLDGRTAMQLAADRALWWAQLRTAGIRRVFALTTTPDTGGGSYLMTAAEQAERVKGNEWMRAGAPLLNGVPVTPGTPGAVTATVIGPDPVTGEPRVTFTGAGDHPLHRVIDAADAVETYRNSQAWKAGYSADGIHPTVGAGTAPIAALFGELEELLGADQPAKLDVYDDLALRAGDVAPVELAGRSLPNRPSKRWAVAAGVVGIIATGLKKLTFSSAFAAAPAPRTVPQGIRVIAAVTRGGAGTHASSFAGPTARRTALTNSNGYSLRAYADRVDLNRNSNNGATSTPLATFARVAPAAGTLEVLVLDCQEDGTIVGYVDGVERHRFDDSAAEVTGSMFGVLMSEGAAAPTDATGFRVVSFRAVAL